MRLSVAADISVSGIWRCRIPIAVSQPAYRTASPYQVDISPLVDWIGSALSVEGAAPSLSTTDTRVPRVAYAGSSRRQLCEQQRWGPDISFWPKRLSLSKPTGPVVLSRTGVPNDRPVEGV